MSEIIKVSRQITDSINALGDAYKQLDRRGQAKAETIANYDKCLAIAIIRLKMGDTLTIEDRKVACTQATVVEKLAKGVCWQEKLNMEKAEAEYKNSITQVEAIKAKLNALQSVFRHLEELEV